MPKAEIIRTKPSDLWEQTHIALVQKNWDKARRLLDVLVTRRVYDKLSSPEAYGVPELLSEVIGARIKRVNAKVK